jgi:hypothetical protein
MPISAESELVAVANVDPETIGLNLLKGRLRRLYRSRLDCHYSPWSADPSLALSDAASDASVLQLAERPGLVIGYGDYVALGAWRRGASKAVTAHWLPIAAVAHPESTALPRSGDVAAVATTWCACWRLADMLLAAVAGERVGATWIAVEVCCCLIK